MKVNEASHRLTLMLCMMHKKCYLKIAAGRYICVRSTLLNKVIDVLYSLGKLIRIK